MDFYMVALQGNAFKLKPQASTLTLPRTTYHVRSTYHISEGNISRSARNISLRTRRVRFFKKTLHLIIAGGIIFLKNLKGS